MPLYVCNLELHSLLTNLSGSITEARRADLAHAGVVNPFTFRASLESIVCYFYTFENNLGIKQKFSKYLTESCCEIFG